MKIIAIMGSAKGKGAGYKIVKMIEDVMKTQGEVEFEYLFLKDVNLKPCTGCYACMAKGEDKCPLKDDRDAILQKLQAANGFILSSPVCVNNVSWLMKNFIDRFAYLNHRPRFYRQKMLTVVNMAGTEKKGALSALKLALGFARGDRDIQQLAVSTPPWLQTERAVAEKERAIDAAAKKFYRACLDLSLPPPSFKAYLDFLLVQKLYRECRQYLPADYAFYDDKTYYFDTNVNPIKAAAARAIVGIIMHLFVMKGMGPGKVLWPVIKKDRLETS